MPRRGFGPNSQDHHPATQPAFPFSEATQTFVMWFHARNSCVCCKLRRFRRRGRGFAQGAGTARELFGGLLLTKKRSLNLLARSQLSTVNRQLSTPLEAPCVHRHFLRSSWPRSSRPRSCWLRRKARNRPPCRRPPSISIPRRSIS